MAENKLSDRHKAFVREYILNGRNATAAYRAVYPKNKNPDTDGPRLLGNAGIQTLILIEENRCEEKFEISRDMLIQQAANIAFGSIDSVLDWDEKGVRLKAKSEMTKADIKFLDGITHENTEFGVRLKVSTLAKEKIKALEFIAKMMGFDKDEGARERPYEAIMAAALLEMKKK
jgi:phage terminase small subunit